MNTRKLIFLNLILSCFNYISFAQQIVSVSSPDARIKMNFSRSAQGVINYAVNFNNQPVIAASALGFTFNEPKLLLDHFDLIAIDSTSHDDTWQPVWGETKFIRNHYKELVLQLSFPDTKPIKLNLIFRVYDDAVAFRYAFPEQPDLQHFVIADENTQFVMTGNHMAFWIPGDYDSNEYPYQHTRLAAIDANVGKLNTEIAVKTIFDPSAVQSPLMMKSDDGVYINIHEAALRNYPAMNLLLNKTNNTFKAALVPDAVGNKAYLQTPAVTPWRTIIISDRAADILASKTILNCNDPSAIGSTDFIKPQKFVGVWWEMHVGKSSWDYSGGQVGSQQSSKVPHGANTANVKRYIDFAAKNGFASVLVEGWNTGWEDWFGKWKEDVFDFVTPYPDYDIAALGAYAKEKNVRIMMHHETSSSVTNYERHMEEAYAFMKKYGMNAVKSGYVGKIIPRGEHHDGQWMIRHYERVAKATAAEGIMVDMHEPVRPTGLHRTYPNWLACEAARGNEFNAWSSGNPPEHETILPFTRLMGGPMDYTPGIFTIKMSAYNKDKKEQVHTTLCKQLALYITMYSPLQMAADLPENYESKMDAFQFIKDVATDWDDTKILEAEPGDYITIARLQKNTQRWFVGAITDEQSRIVKINFSFLNNKAPYLATIYKDAPDADWKENPEAYVIQKVLVNSETQMNIKLAPGGGAALSVFPATAEDKKMYTYYTAKKK